jgi:uncharacterized membrane protein YbhN (UPF0104 family)
VHAVWRWLITSRSARVLGTMVLLALVLWRSQPQRVVDAATALGMGSLLVAATLTIPFLYLKVLRWWYLLRGAGCDTSFTEATLSLMGGMGLALLTPARLGELARIAYLRDQRKLRLGGLVLLDKAFDVIVLALLSAVGAWQIVSPLLGVLLLLAGTVGLVVVYLPDPFEHLLQGSSRRLPFADRVAPVLGALESLSPLATTIYLALTLTAFIVVIAQFGIIIHTSVQLSLHVALLTFPLVILTNVVPLTIAGLGIREGTAALLLTHFHVDTATAVVSAFMMFFLNTALPGIVGALSLPFVRSGTALVNGSVLSAHSVQHTDREPQRYAK